MDKPGYVLDDIQLLVNALITPTMKPIVNLAAIGEARHASSGNGGESIGANAMRSVLVLCLLITLFPSANAATVHRSKSLHAIVRAKQGLSLGFAAPGWAAERPRPLAHYHDTPSYDDPSKYGGGEARPVR
jgi:hypothetical protein